MTQLQIGWCPAACPWWKCFYVFFSLCLLESASDSPTEEDLIRKYFHDGYIDDEILDFLATTHNVKMSLRTLKSKLNSCSLSRQKYYSPLVVRVAIQEELKGPGQHYGCHMMWQTLRQKYYLTVRRDDVMVEFDPAGVQLRARWRFVKRVHSSHGPNHVWHIDCYDKLKLYGLAISGCIDGYSRKVLWLVCGASNNEPGVIAQNYLHCASECGIISMIAQSHGLWHWKWHNGGNPLCLKIITHWFCWGCQSYVWILNSKPTNRKLVIVYPKTEVWSSTFIFTSLKWSGNFSILITTGFRQSCHWKATKHCVFNA